MEQNESLAAVLERALKQAGRAEAIAEELDATKAEMIRREGVLRQRLAAAENTFRVREEELAKKLQALEQIAPPAQGESEAQRREAEQAARINQLQAELAKVRAELLHARAEASDLRLKAARMESDCGALATLTRQQEGEVVVLRGRLTELLASRWRRYGQKLHLCMTLPWEREIPNGRH